MPGSTFQTNPIFLTERLQDCDRGDLQLPDFQRSWVWDEDRIKSLIASVSRAFPVGALMTLATGGPVNFKPRPTAEDQAAPLLTIDALPDGLFNCHTFSISTVFKASCSASSAFWLYRLKTTFPIRTSLKYSVLA